MKQLTTGAYCPVISLVHYASQARSLQHALHGDAGSGLLAGTLLGGYVWANEPHTIEYQAHRLPLPDGCLTWLAYEPRTQHALASIRPPGDVQAMRHYLYRLRAPGDCDVIQQFSVARRGTLMTRSCLFPVPTSDPDACSGLFAAASDEETRSACVWDASTGALRQRLPTNALPVVDIKPCTFNGEHLLALLTEDQVLLHRWQ